MRGLTKGVWMLIFALAIPLSAQQKDSSISQQAEPVDSAKIWFSIGRDYLNKNMFYDAVRNFKRSLSYNPNFISAHLELAKAYIGISTDFLSKGVADSSNYYLKLAEEIYNNITCIDPKDSRGLQGLGFIYGIIKKDYDKALEYYKAAVELDPENADALFGLAKTLETVGQKSSADSVYQAALKKNPNSVGINYSYGFFLIELGKHAEAIDYLEKAYKFGIPDPDKEKEVLLAIVKSAIEAGKNKKEYYNKGLIYVDTLIGRDSANYVYYIFRGDLNAGLGRSTQALRDYDIAINLSGDNPAAHLKKAMYLNYDLKRYNEVIPVVQKLLSLENLNEYYKAIGYFLLGDAYFGIGNETYRKAKAANNRAGAGDAVTYYERAKDSYFKALQYADANLKAQINSRLDAAEKNRSKAFGVWKGIEPW